MKIDKRGLIELAISARDASYSPYSHISVGAALMTKAGKVYLGSNIENASFSPTVCAERVAFFKAVSEGERDFLAIAVVGAGCGEAVSGDFPPCGVCRQVMSEFCDADFVILTGTPEKITEHTLGDMLPHGFDKSNVQL